MPLPGTTIPVFTVFPEDAILATQAAEELAEPLSVVDEGGKVTRQASIPLDAFLLDALQSKTPFSEIVLGLSTGTASLLGLGPGETITEALSRFSGKTKPRVHLELGTPLLTVGPLAKQVRDALINEADVALLQAGGEEDVSTTQRTLAARALREGVDFFRSPLRLFSPRTFGSNLYEDVEERYRGNLEILRIQLQEEF